MHFRSIFMYYKCSNAKDKSNPETIMFYIHIINRGEKFSDFPYNKSDSNCDRTALESAQQANSRKAKTKLTEIVRNTQQIYYLEKRWYL